MSEQVHRADATATPGSLSVVAPAYNEAPNIVPLVREVADALAEWSFELILIDDGSTDETAAQCQHAAELYDQVRAVHLSRNFGQSNALAAGIDYATGETIVTIDADLQNDPADIPRLVNRLHDSDAACVSGNRADRHDPLSKRLPSWIQTHLAKATGPDINDMGCTLKAYDADALQRVSLYGMGHRYIPAKLHGLGYQVAECDVHHRPRKHGETKYGLRRLLHGSLDLLVHWFWNGFSTRPIHLLGGVGVLLFALGGVLGGVSLVQRYLFGVPLAPKTPRLILTALLILFGVQLLVFGILAEMVSRLHYTDRTTYRVRDVVE